MSGHSSAVNGAAFRCNTARESAGLPVSIPLWMPTHLPGPARTISEMSWISPGFVTAALSDLAELAAAAASSHDLVHRVHRRTQDFRDLVDGRGGRVREAHDRGSVVVYDPVENLRDEMVDLAVDDVVDSERFLHFLAVIEMPGAGP